MRDILIMLGSNIDPEVNITGAIAALEERFGVIAQSKPCQTAAIGPEGKPNPEQADFVNLAVKIADAGLDAGALRAELRQIEAALGRVRTADKYAPRPIDMDIALLGDEIHHDEDGKIKIPDPEIFTRSHMALPLAEIAPDRVIPGQDITLKENARRFEITKG